jgi:SSS family solute:Na+ symporter
VGRNIRETKIGIAGAGIFLAFTFPAILFFIALYAKTHFPQIDPEMALPSTVLNLNSPVVGGLIIAALMSAVMSSADSILNSATAIFVKDLYEEYLSKKRGTTERGLLLARASSLSIGILGIVLALILPNIIDLLLLTYNLWAPGIILPVVVGIFSKNRSQSLNSLIFVTMLVSTGATIVYMTTAHSKIMQPSVFGVLVSAIVFAVGRSILNRNKSLPTSSS